MSTATGSPGSRSKAAGAKTPARRRRTRPQAGIEPVAEFSGEDPSRTIKITIGVPSPSANEWTYKHWRAYSRIKKRWLDHLSIAWLPQRLHLSEPLPRVILAVERASIRLLDEDNLVAGLKPIIDGLRALEIIVDDTPDRFTLGMMDQRKVPHKVEQRTILRITER
jgi:hypothetical protein